MEEDTPKATAKRSRSILDGLTLAPPIERQQGYDPIRNRRQKLAAALLEQLHLVEAVLEGEPYKKVVTKRRRDLETDEMFQVQHERKVVPWWHIDDAGKVQFALRHGSSALKVKAGNSVVVLNSLEELKAILPALRQEVMAGKLDGALAEASAEIYGRFTRSDA